MLNKSFKKREKNFQVIKGIACITEGVEYFSLHGQNASFDRQVKQFLISNQSLHLADLFL